MTTNQARVPRGVTSGGEFSTTARSEAGVTLAAERTGVRLLDNGHVDASDLPAKALPWAVALEGLIRTRRRVHEAPAGSPDHHGALLRETVETRALAVMRDPSLVNEPHLTTNRFSEAGAKLLRTHTADIAEMPVPAPMTDDERAAAVRQFTRAAVAESRSRYGTPEGPAAILDCVAAFGAGEAYHLADEVRRDLDRVRSERAARGEDLTGDDAIEVVNAWRRRVGLRPLA